MKKLLPVFLCLLFAVNGLAQRPTTTDIPLAATADGDIKPETINGSPLNLPAGTLIGGSAIGAGISSVSVGNTLFVDAIIGNDGTGERGRLDRPFRTLAAAVNPGTGITSGDAISVGPGRFPVSHLLIPESVLLSGAGPDITFLDSEDVLPEVAVSPSNNSQIENLTIQCGPYGYNAPLGVAGGTNNTPFTGVVVRNVRLIGSSDGIYTSSVLPSALKISNSIIQSNFDAITQVGGGNHAFRATDCEITVVGPFILQAPQDFTASGNFLTVTSGDAPTGLGTRVVLTTTGTLPSPLVPGTTYFIRTWSGATCRLSATQAGAIITLTTSGSGTHTLAVTPPEPARGIVAGSGTLRVFGGSVNVSGGKAVNYGAFTFSSAAQTGTVELNAVNFNVSGTSPYDLFNEAGLISYADVVRSDGAALVTSGAATNLSRNLSQDAAGTILLAPGSNLVSAGLTLANRTDASSANQQFSPARVLEGRGWNSLASASRSVRFRDYVTPVEQAGNPKGTYIIESSINNNTFGRTFSFFSDGGFVVGSTGGGGDSHGSGTIGVDGVYFTSTVSDTTGAGSPDGVVAAGIGSTYRRLDGTATTSLYCKTSGGSTSSGWTAIGTPAWGSITGNLSDNATLQAALDLKANDALALHLAGTESITGTKTFFNGPVVDLSPGSNTQGVGLWMKNINDASLGNLQYAPTLVQEGRVWSTGANASRQIRIRTYAQPIETSAGKVARVFGSSLGAGGAYNDNLFLYHLGGLSVGEDGIDPGAGSLHLSALTADTFLRADADKNVVSATAGTDYIAVTGTPTSGQVPTATSGTTATWQTLPGAIRHGISGAMTGGAVTVTDTGCTANTRYFFTAHTLGTVTVPSAFYASTRTASTSFVITSSQPTDTSTVDWLAIEP